MGEFWLVADKIHPYVCCSCEDQVEDKATGELKLNSSPGLKEQLFFQLVFHMPRQAVASNTTTFAAWVPFMFSRRAKL